MKIIAYSAILLFVLSGCRTNGAGADASKPEQISDGCPPIGRCEFKSIPNKSISIRTDEYGKISYELVDNPTRDVIKFDYINPGPKGVQDGSYREEVIFETDKGSQDLNITGKYLRGANALFGVFCFCKDKAGYYRVDQGNISRKSGRYVIDIPELVPAQKVTRINMEL